MMNACRTVLTRLRSQERRRANNPPTENVLSLTVPRPPPATAATATSPSKFITSKVAAIMKFRKKKENKKTKFDRVEEETNALDTKLLPPGVTHDEIRAYLMAFQQFDKSQDGFINAEELGQLLRTLGENPTEQELIDLICEADMDGSGQVDLYEFIWLMNNREKRARCADEMKLAFKMFDLDNDGLVTASDFRRVIESMGESFTNTEIDHMIGDGDEDKDGMLAYMEFGKLMLTS